MTMAKESIKISFNADNEKDFKKKVGFWLSYLLTKDQKTEEN